MRAVRIAETAPLPWWRRVFSPVTWGSVSAAAAAVALAVLAWGPNRPSTGTSRFAGEDSLSDLQDFAEEEMLVAAADHLSDYSDDELVTLLGF